MFKKRLKISVTIIILLFAQAFVFAQTYDFRNFNVEDGLVQSQVLSMCQDRDGNIWFGTNNGGVSRYDGSKFHNYTENDSLVNNVVFSITELQNGNILFATNGGLSIYNGKKFINYTDKNGLSHNRVFKSIQDNSGTVWIGTSKGVCKLENNKIIPFTLDTLLNKSQIFTMYADKASNIWFGTLESGVIKYSLTSQKFTYYAKAEGLQNNFVRAINEDVKGNIYIGTNTGLHKVNPNGVLEAVTNIRAQENVAFTAIIPDAKNNMWFATNEGIYKYNGYITRKYTDKNGLASNTLMCGIQDREGNFWFGTDGFGVSKFAGEAFFSYSTKDSLPSDYITCIFQDSKKNVWLGVKDFGAVKLFNNKIINYRLDVKNISNSLSDNQVQGITEDLGGNIYFATKEGLSVFDGVRFHNYKKNGLPDDNILSIAISDKNIIWLGTANGLAKFNNGKIEPVAVVNEIAGKKTLPVYSIFEDNKHVLWLSTENGVIQYDGKAITRLNKTNGFTDKRVSTVLQDKLGNFWLGTDEGVFHYNNTTFENINETKGLASNKIYLMLLENDFLWIGTNKGIDKVNLQAFYKNHKIELRHYGKEEGLLGVECNSNSKMKDSDGNLWFGTIKGVTVYNPRYEKINNEEALTKITGIRLFFQNADADLEKYSKGINERTGLPENLVLPYSKNHITFDFIGVCITNPTKVKYQFKLEGADDGWFPPTSKTEATYSSLQPGDYVFHLKAMNNDGLWNQNDVTFKFTILPPWYRTWWFYTLVVIVSVISIYLFITMRTRNLKKAKDELEQEVSLRTFQLRQEKEKVEIINKEVIEQKAIIEAKNHDITDSIKYAKNIQEALLPPLQNLHNELKDAFVLYLPKDIVSGDFYWFAKRNNKRFIASVDCTGHGVPGAFMSIVGNTLLNEIVSDKNITEPAEILNELHAGVKAALKQSNSENERRDGMDIALCALNEDGTVLEYAGANRPLWIFRKNKSTDDAFEMVKANKFPIGGLEMENEVKRQFTNHTINVEKGDVIYIFSDGYADQFGGEKGKKYMLGNLQKLITTIYTKPIKDQKELLHDNFVNWKGDLEQVDDVLVIGIRI